MTDLFPSVGAGAILDQVLLANDRAMRIGAIQRLDYHEAVVLTHDRWKFESGGIPQFSYLIATAKDIAGDADDDEVLLLRVEGTAPLTLESDLHAVREEALRNALSRTDAPSTSEVLDLDIDPFTKNRSSFTGLQCKILGTFYEEDIEGTRTLLFGSDVDNFYATSSYRVLKPVGDGLAAIASFLKQTGDDIERMPLGVVRYSATRRRAKASGQADSVVSVNIRDFIGHKTGLLGMTRSGKSNTAKILVARTFITSETRRRQGLAPIGQLIFDPQGEYANVNTQDGTEIAAIGGEHVRIYKYGQQAEGSLVKPLGINFFDETQIDIVQDLIASELRKDGASGYINDFAEANFQSLGNDRSAMARASRGRLILYAALVKAGFAAPRITSANRPFRITVMMKGEVKDAVVAELGRDPFEQGRPGLVVLPMGSLVPVVESLLRLRDSGTGPVPEWLNEPSWTSTEPIFSGVSSSGGTVRGYRNLYALKAFHNPDTLTNVAAEIYGDLLTGKIVIVDTHIGSDEVTRRLAELITVHILNCHTDVFTNGEDPAPIQVMLEEAHNLFSTKNYDKGVDVWVRLAKEASKLKIGMIYATQEVSGVAHQVKANTANWVVSHLNNHTELNELGKFYDFGSYKDAILASEDRGYVRLKTLSSPYIVPVQVEKYGLALVNSARSAAGLDLLPLPHAGVGNAV